MDAKVVHHGGADLDSGNRGIPNCHFFPINGQQHTFQVNFPADFHRQAVHIDGLTFDSLVLLASIFNNGVFHKYSPIFTSPDNPRQSSDLGAGVWGSWGYTVSPQRFFCRGCVIINEGIDLCQPQSRDWCRMRVTLLKGG